MKLAPVLTTFCLIASPTAAAAADFTFDVPVRIENAPSMTTAYIDCVVWRAAVGEVYSGPGNMMGRGGTSVPVTGGRYEGTVTIEVNASGIIPAADARSYSCSLRAVGTSRSGTTYSAMPDNFRTVYETATGQTLTLANNQTRANLP